jgi:hypothetical protein
MHALERMFELSPVEAAAHLWTQPNQKKNE